MKQVRLAGFALTTQSALSRMLQFMDRAAAPTDLDLPGWRLHPLKGELAEYWSLSVSGNWPVIFRFAGSDIELIDYLDYH